MEELPAASYWESYQPQDVAAQMSALWGELRAKHAAHRCACNARLEGRQDQEMFWMAVLLRLYGRDLDDHFVSNVGNNRSLTPPLH